jgi:hypothetical protein
MLPLKEPLWGWVGLKDDLANYRLNSFDPYDATRQFFDQQHPFLGTIGGCPGEDCFLKATSRLFVKVS